MRKEGYVSLPFTDEYLINKQGSVWSVKRNKEVKRFITLAGYYFVVLYIKGKRRQYQLHRLLMRTFRPVANWEHMVVDHIDGNPTNNTLSNLEWVTAHENARRASVLNKIRPPFHKRPVTVFDITKEQEVTYPTPNDAAHALGITTTAVKGRLNSAFGAVFDDGTMAKWADDKREFPVVSDIAYAIKLRKRQRAVIAKNHLTGEISRYETLRSFCKAYRLSEGVASIYINKHDGMFWFGVEAHYEVQNLTFATLTPVQLFRISYAYPGARPIVCFNTLENKAYICSKGNEVAEAHKLATSTLSWYANKGWGGANGWVYNYLDTTDDAFLIKHFDIEKRLKTL